MTGMEEGGEMEPILASVSPIITLSVHRYLQDRLYAVLAPQSRTLHISPSPPVGSLRRRCRSDATTARLIADFCLSQKSRSKIHRIPRSCIGSQDFRIQDPLELTLSKNFRIQDPLDPTQSEF